MPVELEAEDEVAMVAKLAVAKAPVEDQKRHGRREGEI